MEKKDECHKMQLKEAKRLVENPKQGGNQKTMRITSKTHYRKLLAGEKIFKEGKKELEGERQKWV